MEKHTVLCVGICRFSQLCPVWSVRSQSSPSTSVLWMTNGHTIHRERQRSCWDHNNSEKQANKRRNKAAGLPRPNCEIYLVAAVNRNHVKSASCWTNESTRSESPETDSHICWQGALGRGAKAFHLRKTAFRFMVVKPLDIHLHKKRTLIHTVPHIRTLILNKL